MFDITSCTNNTCKKTRQFFFLFSLGLQKWALWSSDPLKATRCPSKAQAASRSAANRTVSRHDIRVIGN